MERIKTMCRICLVENVRMNEVNNRHLQEVYEKLTDIPFVTEDNRPMLACFFCYTKLKQCWQLQRKCLKAEELFAKLLNEGYKFNLKNQNQLEFLGGFTETKLENISIGIGDVCEGQSAAIKEELSDVCETQDDIEIKVEHLSDVSELENLQYTDTDLEDNEIAQQHSKSEDDLPLVKIEIEEEGVQEIPKKKLRVNETNSAPTTKTQHFKKAIENEGKDISSKPEKTRQAHSTMKKKTKRKIVKIDDNVSCNTAIQTVMYNCDVCHDNFCDSKTLKRHVRTHTAENLYQCDKCPKSFVQNSQLKRHSRTHTGEKPYKCDTCQKGFRQKSHLTAHIRIHTGESPFKCDICQRSFSQISNLKGHIKTHSNEKSFKCVACPIISKLKVYKTPVTILE